MIITHRRTTVWTLDAVESCPAWWTPVRVASLAPSTIQPRMVEYPGGGCAIMVARTGTLVEVAAPKGRTEIQDGHHLLIERMLALTPEQRLVGLQRAAAFFAAARRV